MALVWAELGKYNNNKNIIKLSIIMPLDKNAC